MVTASLAARIVITDYANRIIERLEAGEFSSRAEGFAARWAELAWRLTLVFHAVEHGGAAHLNEVPEHTALQAVAVVSWFAVQQLELLDERESDIANEQTIKVMNLVSRHGRISASLVQKSGVCATPQEAKAVLEQLEAQGVLASQTTTGRGRRTRYYFRPPNHGNRAR
jgi:hypothetical protein